MDLRPGERLFWLTDIGWIMGPWAIIGVLANGGTLVLYDGAPDHPGPDRLWEFVARHRVAILGVSPTLVRALMAHGDEPVRAHDRSSLRVLASTGEPWNEAPWEWYFSVVGERRCPVINISGGTEVGACFLSPHVVQPLSPCSLGGPALGMAVDVFDDDGRPVRGAVGELVCTRPWPGMTRGLWKDAERYLETYWSRYPGVWWHGDFARVTDDGQWFLHGRSDDTIKLAGKRLGPAEVETVVVAHPAVLEAAAIGVPDEVKGEALWVFVVPTPGVHADDALRDELRALVADQLGSSFRPAAVRFTDALPKTRSAKVLRRAIRAVVTDTEPGDLSGLEDPAALTAIAEARVDVHEIVGSSGVVAAAAGRRLGCVARGAHAVPRLARAVGAARRTGQRRSCPRAGGVPSAVRRVGTAAPLRRRVRVRDVPHDGRFAGEVSLGSVQRGPFQMGYIGYWIDEALVRTRLRARRRRAADAARVRVAVAAPSRSGDRAAQRREPARRREARPARRRHRRAVSYRSKVCSRITCATRSPSRSGTRAATNSSPSSSTADASLSRNPYVPPRTFPNHPCPSDHACWATSVAMAASKSGCQGT